MYFLRETFILALLLLLSPAVLQGQTQSKDGVWTRLDKQEAQTHEFQPLAGTSGLLAAFRLNQRGIDNILKTAPREFTEEKESPAVVFIPFPDGSFERFRVEESPVIQKPLESPGHETYTYKGVGIDDPSATIRFERSFDGFHAMVRASVGVFYIDPASTKPMQEREKPYLSYFAAIRSAPRKRLHCEVSTEHAKQDRQRLLSGRRPVSTGQTQTVLSAVQALRVYKIALAVNSYYVAAVYDNKLPASPFDQAAAAVTRSLNRINGIYESELGIHLNMVDAERKIIYTDPNTDPYRSVNSDSIAALKVNQENLDAVIGTNNYDIGHLFATDTAGRASVGSVCNPDYKGQGVTGIANPTGDDFDVDYVAHEIGHQFGANHTFNAISGYCNGNRNAQTAYEPGSGSTIMGYAGPGICDPDSLQDHSDSYFHIGSLLEIRDFLSDTSAGGGSCGTTLPLSYPPPPIPTSAAYTIPKGTPFVLSALVNGPSSPFIFTWEEFDLGDPAPPDDEDGPNPTPRPLFRSKAPSGSSLRFFPDFPTLIQTLGAPTLGEALPMLDRTMKFRAIVRNDHGSFSYSEFSVKVDANSGPFRILPNTSGNTWQRGSSHTLQWDLAGSDKAPVSCSRVRVQLAIDEDSSKLFTLAAGVPNSGSYDVVIPGGTPLTSHGRLILKSDDNIFLAVSPFTVQITPGN